MRPFIPTLLALLAPTPALAQDNLPAAIAACREVGDDDVRLACYDRAAGRLVEEGRETDPAAAEPDPLPAEPPPAPAEPEAGPEDLAAASGPDPGDDEYRAGVTKVARRVRGELVVTLDNGETWEELSPSRFYPLEPGDTVELKSGMFGSWRMVSPAGRVTRVRRID